MTMRPVRVVLTVVLTILLLAGCGIQGTGDKGYESGDSGVVEYAAKDRRPVEAINGETLEGEQVSLKELAAGRPVVVNVWAPWCGPCRSEAKDLNAAAKRLGDKAVFLGINIRSTKANSLAFQRTYSVSYPSLFDPDSRALLAFPSGTVPPAIPSTLVIDADGKVSASVNGPIPSVQTLVTLVEDAS